MFRLATLVNNSNGQNKHTCMLSGLTNVAEFTYGIVLLSREIALGCGSIGIRASEDRPVILLLTLHLACQRACVFSSVNARLFYPNRYHCSSLISEVWLHSLRSDRSLCADLVLHQFSPVSLIVNLCFQLA